MPLLAKLCQNIVLIQGFKKSKNKFSPYKQFELAYANAEDIHLAEKSLHVNKAKGAIGISAKFVKMLADSTDFHIANIISKDISDNKYSKNANLRMQDKFFKRGIEQK